MSGSFSVPIVEEILKRAKETFKTVQPARAHGRFYGGYKDTEPENIYASIQSLSREKATPFILLKIVLTI